MPGGKPQGPGHAGVDLADGSEAGGAKLRRLREFDQMAGELKADSHG